MTVDLLKERYRRDQNCRAAPTITVTRIGKGYVVTWRLSGADATFFGGHLLTETGAWTRNGSALNCLGAAGTPFYQTRFPRVAARSWACSWGTSDYRLQAAPAQHRRGVADINALGSTAVQLSRRTALRFPPWAGLRAGGDHASALIATLVAAPGTQSYWRGRNCSLSAWPAGIEPDPLPMVSSLGPASYGGHKRWAI